MRRFSVLAAVLLMAACTDTEIPSALAPEDAAFRAQPHMAEAGEVAFPDVIPLPTGFQPEGIALGDGHEIYVGSFISGAVYRADLRTGEGALVVPPAPGERMSVGLSYDRRSRMLFAAGGLTGGGFVYDTETGDVAQAYSFGDPGVTFVNDVVVTRRAAYFTDSFKPLLYRIPLGPRGEVPDPSAVEIVALSGDFEMTTDCAFVAPVNANGIDATPNGDYLIVVNLCLGTLYRVDPETGAATLIDLGGDNVLFGDGILLDGRTLYVVQNVLNQIAVIRLNAAMDAGAVVGIITDPAFRVPATIAKFGSSLYAVNARFDVAPPPDVWPDVEFEVVRVATELGRGAAPPAASPLVPLKGRTRGGVVGVVSPPNRCPPTHPLLMLMEGQGHFTHMGRTRIVGSECVPMDLTDPTVTVTLHGRYTMHAASGDSIQVAYETAEIVREADPPRMGWVAEPHVVEGFGRFVGVEFVDVIWAGWILDPETFAMTSTVNGWLRF